MPVKKPNFLIVGAAKCGTTSLYAYLRQHPDIFMPEWKELSYYSADPHGPLHKARSAAFYRAAFVKARGENRIGEASTSYLYDATSPSLIRDGLGRIRILIILRNPVAMAYSLYQHQRRKEGEWLPTFKHALAAEAGRMQDPAFPGECYGWHANYYYFDRGLYCQQVKRYIDTFGRDRVQVVFFEDLVNDTPGVLRQVFRFLEVDDTFMPQIRIHNKTGRLFDVPVFWTDYGLFLKTLQFVLRGTLLRKARLIRKKAGLPPPEPIDKELARALFRRFRPDIERLETLLHRSLAMWREKGSPGANRDEKEEHAGA